MNGETKFFGVSPLSLVDSFYNSLEAGLQEAIDDLSGSIAEQVSCIGNDHAVLLLGGGDDIRRAVKATAKRRPYISLGDLYILADAANVELPLQAVRASNERFFDRLQDATDTLRKDVLYTAARTADKFELYLLRNLMTIPDGVEIPQEQSDEEVDEESSTPKFFV